MRIPLKNETVISEFVLLELNEEDKFCCGRIIKLSESVSGDDKPKSLFNGQIVLSYLDRKQIVRSRV